MPIRIEHQPSPYAVGLAAWQTGRGAARQRQQKYALDLWQQDQQNRYMEDRQDQRQRWMESLDSQRGVQRGWMSIAASLPQIPENATPEQRQQLQKKMQFMTLAGSGAYGMDQTVQDKLGETLDEINTILGAIPQLDAGEQASKNWGYLNPKTGARGKLGEQPAEGMLLWDYSSGRPVYDDSSQQAAVEKQRLAEQEKQQAAQQKAQQDTYDEAKRKQEQWDDWYAEEYDKVKDENPDWIPEQIGGTAIRNLRERGRGFRPQLPPPPTIAPAATTQPAGGAAVSEFKIGPDGNPRPVAPAAGAGGGMFSVEDEAIGKVPVQRTEAAATMQPRQWAGPGERPQRQPRDPAVEVVPGDWGKWQMGATTPLPRPTAHRNQTKEERIRLLIEESETIRDRDDPRLTEIINELRLLLNPHLVKQRPEDKVQDSVVTSQPNPATARENEPWRNRWGHPWPEHSPEEFPGPSFHQTENGLELNDVFSKNFSLEGEPMTRPSGLGPHQIQDADKQRIRGMIAAQNQPPKPTGYAALPPEFRERVRRAYEAGNATTRAAIEERWPGIRPLDEMYPDEQQMIVPPSTLQQHTEAQYGARRGTGEGIRSDAAAIAGRLEGADALAGRMREPAARPTVTKYSLGPEEERAAKMAKWIKYQNAMDRLGEPKAATSSSTSTQTATVGEPGLYLGAGAGTGTPPAPVARTPVLPDVARFAELESRSNAARAQGIGRGIDRAQRLGKTSPAVAAAIQAALRGDRAAQRALEERGIQWRT